MLQNAGAVLLIDEKLRQCQERYRFRLFQEGIDAMLKDVFGAWAPVVRPEIPQNTDEGRNDERALIRIH